MKRLPLYEAPPLAAVQCERPLNVTSACARCELPKLSQPRQVCMSAEGEAGGLLVVGDYPTREEDAIGRPFSSGSGRAFREQVLSLWKGPIAFDLAVKCLTSRDVKLEKVVESCRGYLAGTIAEAAPTRIIAVGGLAARSIVGRSVYAMGQRRSYAFLPPTTPGGKPIPVFFLMPPGQTARNRFLRHWAREDLEWALTANPPVPSWDGIVHVIETAEDAETAVGYTRAFDRTAFDCETAGVMYDPSFRLVALSICCEGDDSGFSFLWPSEALRDPKVSAPLKRWLTDPTSKKSGQNVKFDIQAVWCGLKVWPQGVTCDSRLQAKLLDPECLASLDKLAETIGMGGMKQENKDAITDAVGAVGAILSAERRYLKALSTGAKKVPPRPPPLSSLGIDAALESVVRDKEQSKESWVYAVLDKVDRPIMHRYNARDSVATAELCVHFEKQLQSQASIKRVWHRIVEGASDAVAQVEAWGMPCDLGAIELFDTHLSMQETATLNVLNGHFPDTNWKSTQQLRKILFQDLGLPVVKLTESELESTDGDVLEELQDRHPMIPALIEYRRVTKLRSTYAAGMRPFIRSDGRIHPSILLDGAATGRTSCIAGWCLVLTRRGAVPMASVAIGDEVWTHRKRWRRVTAAWSNGVRPVVRARLSNGEELTCTADHRVLTEAGWLPVGEAHELQQGVGDGRGQRGQGCCAVPKQRVSYVREDRCEALDSTGERSLRGSESHTARGAQGTGVVSVLSQQAGGSKSNEGQDGRGASQLEGGLRGWSRIPDVHMERQENLRSPRCHDGSSWDNGASDGHGGASHRRGQEEQHARQLGTHDERGAHAYSLLAGEGLGRVVIEELQAGGSVEVFDLSVEEDESFAVCGVLAHNCRDPNLQNIPNKRTPDGKLARDVFTAARGYKLVQLDYSQLELRIAAMLSQDQKMIDIFRSGIDYHRRTAQLVSKTMWGIDMTEEWIAANEEKASGYRTLVKPVNFGILYGKTARTLSMDLKCSVQEAQKAIDAIFGAFSDLHRWCKSMLSDARRTGEIWTQWDGEPARRRSLWRIAEPEDGIRITAENGAVNTPVQGSASDYCVASLVAAVNWIRESNFPARLVVPVHDSLMFEVREDCVDELAVKVRDIMEGWPSGGVPLVADCEVGQSWGSIKKYAYPDRKEH